MATEAQARRLVDSLDAELMRRKPEVTRNNDYYRGRQRLAFASDQFRKYHADRYRGFADNWVQVVSDSPVERLTVNGIQPYGADAVADDDMWRVWQSNGLDADSQLGFLGSVNAGRSFVLVWGNPSDEATPVVTFEDASMCVVAYAPGSRRERVAGLKKWVDGSSEYATLYLSGEVWKFERALYDVDAKSAEMRQVDDELRRWTPRAVGTEPNPQPNPMGAVPLIELPNRPMLVADPISDVSGVTAMQDAVNLMWAMLFTASDYASFPQRIVTGAEIPEIPVLDASGTVVGSRPVDLERFAVDRVMFFEGDNVRTSEWTAANLNAYTDVIEVAVGHIAAQTRTPQHYLIGKMANLSGDALLAAETGLVKRVEEKQIWFGQALREMFRLIALAQGDSAKASSLSAGTVLWANAESRSDAQLADALLKLKTIGFPFEKLAALYGLKPAEIAALMEMRQREADLDPLAAATALMQRSPGAPPEGVAA